MKNEKYKLRYLPLFEQDLIQTVSCITNVLNDYYGVRSPLNTAK